MGCCESYGTGSEDNDIGFFLVEHDWLQLVLNSRSSRFRVYQQCMRKSLGVNAVFAPLEEGGREGAVGGIFGEDGAVTALSFVPR